MARNLHCLCGFLHLWTFKPNPISTTISASDCFAVARGGHGRGFSTPGLLTKSHDERWRLINKFVREGVVSGEIGWTIEVASLGRSVLLPHAIDMAYLDAIVRHRGQILSAPEISMFIGGAPRGRAHYRDDNGLTGKQDAALAATFG